MCGYSAALGFVVGVVLWVIWDKFVRDHPGFQDASIRSSLSSVGAGMYGVDPIDEFRKQIQATHPPGCTCGCGNNVCPVCSGVVDPQLANHNIGYYDVNYPR